MDMDSSSENWLGISLSNIDCCNLSSTNSSEPCLFQAFNSNPNSALVKQIENLKGGGGADGSPKLADFLGDCGGISSSGSNNEVCLFTSSATTTCEYGSELKSIAASFLRNQKDAQKQLSVVAPPPPPDTPAKKPVETFGQRTSIYRGVTRHRWTGRYEAHLWDNSCRREGQSRKGRQVYLGGYDKEEKAARAYDLAALKYWGPTTTTNFPVSNYEKELDEMKSMTRQEFVASLRRRSSGFSRGASIYRGVTRHHQHGRWQARIGRVAGNKDLYLGTFSTQEEAAEAYDIAAIKFRGLNAVTNFDISRYDVKSIATRNLPVGGMNNKSKSSSLESASESSKNVEAGNWLDDRAQTPTVVNLGFGLPIKQDASGFWSILGCANEQNRSYKNATTCFHGTTMPAQGATLFSSNGNVIFSEEGYYHDQQRSGCSSTTSSVPSSETSMALSSNNIANTTIDGSSFGNNLAPFQTPIFGME